MTGINKAILIGNLGHDPELRYTQSGQPVCNFTLATTEKWRNKSGEQQESTEWHRIVAWGKTGELCAKYLSKGRTAYIEGRIQTHEWENKDGQKQKTTEINATTVQFLGGGGSGGNREANGRPLPEPTSGRPLPEPTYGRPLPEPTYGRYPALTPDDDIPF